MAAKKRSKKTHGEKSLLTMAANSDLSKDDVTRYLEGQSELDLLRFITCGSVDDGVRSLSDCNTSAAISTTNSSSATRL